MVSKSYFSKEDKIERRLSRLKELLMAHKATNSSKSSNIHNSKSKIDVSLRQWAERMDISESEFSKRVQQLVKENS